MTAGADCKFGIWGATDGKCLTLQQPRGVTDRCTCVKWNCGSKQFLVATIGPGMSYVLIYDFSNPNSWRNLKEGGISIFQKDSFTLVVRQLNLYEITW